MLLTTQKSFMKLQSQWNVVRSLGRVPTVGNMRWGVKTEIIKTLKDYLKAEGKDEVVSRGMMGKFLIFAFL